jgi:hypothetical protein
MSVHIKTGSCVARSWLKLETKKIEERKKKIIFRKEKEKGGVRYVVIDRKRLYQIVGGGFRFGS